MAPMTLRSLEAGGTGVTIGAYLAVMQVLGIERDLDRLAETDSTGRALQDARLSTRKERTAPAGASTERKVLQQAVEVLSPGMKSQRKPAHDPEDWIEESGFSSSRALSTLIDTKEPPPKTKRH